MPGGNSNLDGSTEVRGTVSPGQFIFKDHAFAANKSELDKLDVGELLEDEKHHWEGAGFAIKKMDRRYDGFVRTLIEGSEPKTDQNVTQPKEKFIAHISNALTISHSIIQELTMAEKTKQGPGHQGASNRPNRQGVQHVWDKLNVQGVTKHIITPTLASEKGGAASVDVGAIVSGMPSVFARAILFRNALDHITDPDTEADGLITFYKTLVDE